MRTFWSIREDVNATSRLRQKATTSKNIIPSTFQFSSFLIKVPFDSGCKNFNGKFNNRVQLRSRSIRIGSPIFYWIIRRVSPLFRSFFFGAWGLIVGCGRGHKNEPMRYWQRPAIMLLAEQFENLGIFQQLPFVRLYFILKTQRKIVIVGFR